MAPLDCRSMSVRCLFSVSVICVLAGSALVAAEFWETKPFREWSDKEARRMLENSPWAALIAVPLPNRGPVPAPDSTGGGRGGGRGGGGAEGFGPEPVRVRLTISWRSALPLKQATARQQAGNGGTIAPETEAALAREDELYVVAIQGLPPQYSQSGPTSTIDGFLHRDGKPDIPAARGASQPARGGAILFVGFPRTDPITLADGDVEFEVKIGSLSFKKKFKLKDMVFHGRLEL
jgi:hypothetical protein